MTTQVHQVETRTAQLDPEVRRRGLFGMSRIMVIAWSVSVGTAILLWLSVRGWPGAIAGFTLLGVLALSTTRFGEEPSWAQRRVHWIREFLRRRRGEHIFWSVADRGDRTGRPSANYDPDADPAWVRPVPLGRVEPLPLEGTGFDGLFVLRHSNPGETAYLSVLMQVQGLKGGLRSAAAYSAAWQSFGFLESELAKYGSHIRGIQQIHRSVSYDLNPHLRWYADSIVFNGDQLERMVDAYDSALDEIRPLAEEHRTWYVVKIPIDDRFISEAAGRDTWGSTRRAEVGWASVVKDELERFENLARSAGLGEVTVLGERRTCAVIRSLMDPDYALDDDRDADWESCWQSYFGDHDAVIINNRHHTRVAYIPPGAIAPTPLGPLWLHPLLVGVEADEGTDDTPRAATIRTVSVRMDFIPDRLARAQAVSDLTQDAATAINERKKGKVDDGTSEVMMTSSQRRRRDLTPGSGAHGMNWAMWVAVTGRDAEDVRRACLRVSDAAGKAAISKLEWEADRHDVNMIATLPLARGMAGSKDARTA